MRIFTGAWPALATPITEHGEINVPVLRETVEYLVDKQVDGLYIGGTTGEGIFRSLDSRQLVAETVSDQVNSRIPIIIHVGSISVDDAITLAKHADYIKADGISSVVTPYYKNVDSLYHYYEQVGSSVPEMPLLAYMFGGTVNAVSLMQKLMKIPTLAGAKYSGADMFEFRQLVELREENWTIFSGMDEQCLFAAMSGAHGNVGSTLNFMPGVYREIRKSAEEGNYHYGIQLQNRANKITRIMQSYGFESSIKPVMHKIGFDFGKPCLPNLPLPEKDLHGLYNELDKTDFLELVQM